MVTIFRLAVDLADVAAESAESTEPLDANKEASRLVREHPEADVSVAEVAAVLEEEAEAAGAEVAQSELPGRPRNTEGFDEPGAERQADRP